ncbi:hypothetical protein HOLleu_11123 [Holothuria leucospilota]|uniref:Tesmin/TSO1-like CXC domain-containing protein n=1 Tax=Holothuria leucospilota TaxID=206669 RepID=A0A9Q1HG74_HOLLE|nr:hypothetical protein HOLleu_11123 [Holothuria leucospilota]
MPQSSALILGGSAHREHNFRLYVEALKAVTPWFFALDHQNYARWMPIHIRDMESLPPSIRKEFEEHGNWVVNKTNNRFSAMPIDQAHEQNNEFVEGLRCPPPKTQSKQTGKIAMLKNDVALFSRLYIVMQHREGDMNQFFQHENHPFPPSLSDNGRLRFAKKSDLLTKLEQTNQNDPPSSFDVKVLDGAAVVHLLSTNNVSTFDEYADKVFVPYIKAQLDNSKRVDVVWDTYINTSIKESTREKRGEGARRKVEGKNAIPGNWKDFLRDSKNKQELFAFLTDKIAMTTCPDDKEIFITSGRSVIGAGCNHRMMECDHEEADTRIMVHVQDALENGSIVCQVRTVDTDVIVILIGKFHHLLTLNPDANIWVAFGTGKHFSFFHVNEICMALGDDTSVALPVFHSFTGCDTTSAFYRKGWRHTQLFKLLERFVVVLYDKTSNLESINEARRELFCQKNRPMENIPPTLDALLQHSKRAAFQAGIWTTSNLTIQESPTPEGWGWTRCGDNQRWVPVWITQPITSKACSELVKCGCKSNRGCGGRRACKGAHWKCTELCSCTCEKRVSTE